MSKKIAKKVTKKKVVKKPVKGKKIVKKPTKKKVVTRKPLRDNEREARRILKSIDASNSYSPKLSSGINPPVMMQGVVKDVSEFGFSIAPTGSAAVKPPDTKFPTWPDAKCGTCGADASKDPNGENFLHILVCPECQKEGCDECMPAGRGCLCPECEEKPHNKYNEDPPDGMR